MKIHILVTFLTSTLALVNADPNNYYQPHPKPHHPHCCLTDRDAYNIINNWRSVFDASKKVPSLQAVVYKALAPNFVAYEETLNGGASPISFPNRDAVVSYLTPQQTTEGPFTGLRFINLFTFHDCENIAWRWQGKATTTGRDFVGGGPVNTTAVPPGSKFQWKGIDLLKVDCRTKKIKAAYTSQDIFNLLGGVGFISCPAA